MTKALRHRLVATLAVCGLPMVLVTVVTLVCREHPPLPWWTGLAAPTIMPFLLLETDSTFASIAVVALSWLLYLGVTYGGFALAGRLRRRWLRRMVYSIGSIEAVAFYAWCCFLCAGLIHVFDEVAEAVAPVVLWPFFPGVE